MYGGDRSCKRDTNIRAKSGRRERRRWESNPLRPGCSRWPGRLAPASRFWQYPRQESNLILDLRRVACDPPHSKDNHKSQIGNLKSQYPPGNRTQSGELKVRYADHHTREVLLISNFKFENSNLRIEIIEISNFRLPHRGVEPRLTASNAVVRPSHSQGQALPNCSAKESNLVSRFRRPRCVRHTRRAFQNVLARSRT